MKAPHRAHLLTACLFTMGLQAQTFTYHVNCVVMPCVPGDSVHLTLSMYNDPTVVDTLLAVDEGSCTADITFLVANDYPSVMADMTCQDLGPTWDHDSTTFSFPELVEAWDTLVLDCGGVPYDCAGMAFGTHWPGTPCEDGNPTTTNELYNADCHCIGDTTNLFDCLGNPGGPAMPGTPCDDLDSLNTNDTWGLDCHCHGEPFSVDCFGTPDGPAMPGTPCDDGNPLTVGDTWTTTCACAGYPAPPCGINFQVAQAMEFDSTTSVSTPIPSTLWVTVQSTGQWPYQYFWDFGDGTTSTDPWPTHTYAGNGPYDLCVTITDAVGCSSTACDSVSVDADGMINGMVVHGSGHSAAWDQRSGFTVMVQHEVVMSIHGPLATRPLTLWPNPATSLINVVLDAMGAGTVNMWIINGEGRAVRTGQATPAQGMLAAKVDIAHLPGGIYRLQLTDGREVRSVSFVKLP